MPAVKRSTTPLALPALQSSLQPPLQRSFIDTNILVYADSPDEPAKQQVAIQLLTQLRQSGLGVISTQVLNEYCNVALNKLKRSHAGVRAQLQFFTQFEVVNVTPQIVEAAVDLHQTRALSYFDALMVAAAQTSGCGVLFSEDMLAGEVVGGVRIWNPF